MSVNIRKTVLELLRSYELEGRYVNLLLSSHKLDGLSREEQAAVTALLYTTVEKKLTYDYFLCAFAGRSMDTIDPYVRDVLRIGLCQIIHMKSIPDFAAVNETVKLGRHKGERAFINAVLRRAVASKDCLPYPDKAKNFLRYLSVFYSVPQKTVRLLSGIFDDTELTELLSAFSKPAPLSVTVNTKKASRDSLIERLSPFGASESRYTETGIDLSESISPMRLPGFEKGEFFVQDEASRIEAAVLDAGTGHTVIDVCSAPGGKSFAAAIAVGESGRVYSFDIHESKLSLINDGASRLGLNNITVEANDATSAVAELLGTADRVICDVPCSGLGVFAKKPDLRYKDVNEAAELPTLQYEILTESAKYLKVGGILVYSTCTINPAENEDITDKFVAENGDFVYEKIELLKLSSHSGKLTLLPHKHGTDGFYIAKLRKIK